MAITVINNYLYLCCEVVKELIRKLGAVFGET